MYTSHVKGLNSSSLSDMSHSKWIFDSRASHHKSFDNKSFLSLNNVSSMLIMTADETPMPLLNIGYVSIIKMSLFDVYYIHILTLSLAYVSHLCDSGYFIIFSSTSYYG